MGEMAVNVIYKGGASNIAQMSLSSIDEMFGMSKYSHSKNMRIYGGGKDVFLIFQREIPIWGIWNSKELLHWIMQ